MISTAQSLNIKNLTQLGVCGIEARWLETVRGTSYMAHPVARARAKTILDQARNAIDAKNAVYRLYPSLRICR